MLVSKVAKSKPEASPSRADERQRATKLFSPKTRPPGGARASSWDFERIALFPPERRSSSPPPAAARLSGAPQAKLVVGAVDDPLEREADQVADQVMRMTDRDVSVSASPPRVSRKCAACEDGDENLRAAPAGTTRGAGHEAALSIVHEALRTPGRPLDDECRDAFERGLGRDFSSVRIHADFIAAASARALDARRLCDRRCDRLR